MCRLILLSGALFLLAACTSGDGIQRDEGPTGADSVAMALEQYDPAAFDTITWESREALVERGGTVYRISCAKCHGNAGRGDGGFVVEGDTVQPPSFLQDGWRFADDRDALLERIYAGTENEMPHWGLAGLKYRDVDAVATYILEIIRLEVDG